MVSSAKGERVSFPGYFGMAARVYGEAHRDWRSDLTAVTRKNKANGLKNPLAQMGEDVSAETVEHSPLVADPLRLYDCCPISDGAAAVVIAADDAIREGFRRGRQAHRSASRPRCRRARAESPAHQEPPELRSDGGSTRAKHTRVGRSHDDIDFDRAARLLLAHRDPRRGDLGVVPRGARRAPGRAKAARGPRATCRSRFGRSFSPKAHPVGATGVGQLVEAGASCAARIPIRSRMPASA